MENKNYSKLISDYCSEMRSQLREWAKNLLDRHFTAVSGRYAPVDGNLGEFYDIPGHPVVNDHGDEMAGWRPRFTEGRLLGLDLVFKNRIHGEENDYVKSIEYLSTDELLKFYGMATAGMYYTSYGEWV